MGSRRRFTIAAACALTAACAAGGGGIGIAGSLRAVSADAQAVQVSAEVHHDTSPPLRSLTASGTPGHAHPAIHHGGGPGSGTTNSPDTSRQSATANIPTTTTNFSGIGANGSAPPDDDGAIGPTQFVELVNTELAVYSKTGSVLLSPRATNTLWSGFGGGCQTNNDGDGTIVFDPLDQHWVIQQFSVSTTPYLECIAVSTGTDATGSWNRYSFPTGANFPDYPKLGAWADGYYVSYNMFNAAGTQGLGTLLCAYDRSQMVLGLAATQQCFTATTAPEKTFLPASIDGNTAPPAGEPEWFVGLSPTTANALAYYTFHVDFANPANSTLTPGADLGVNAFSMACGGQGTCIPQSGTRQQLDSLGDRLMYRLAYRNLGSHEAMVVSHSVTSGTSVGERWYELRPSGGALTVFQQGTYAPDSNYRWMGSIAMDQAGDMGLGYSVSSGSLHPGLRYTGRLVTDSPGQMPQGEATIFTGGGSQTGGLSRWGDYSEMTVDPVDGCTFWYVNEYLPSNGSFNWATRIGSFRFPSCGGTQTNDFSMSANPTSVSTVQGGSPTSTIGTSVISGSAQTISLSASGQPSGVTVSFSPSSVSAGSSSTMTMATTTSVAPGTYTITVTGSNGSTSHTTAISLTVTATPPANDFSISASPSTVTITQGGSGTTTVSTAVTSGSAQSVSLGAAGLPSGASAGFNPAGVTAGGSSTMTITTTSTAATGTVTVTITGTGTSATHSTTISLTINPPAVSGVVNGGFETGTFSGWTTAGQAEAVVGGGHSGSYAAELGSTSPTNGDSTMQQTVAVPSAGGTLSFWYQPHCPDTVTYDQEQMEIRSTASAVLATLLNTCSNSGAWTMVSANLAGWAGQSIVLWFNNHDDNYPSDPTYTLFDDVAIGPPPGPNVVQNGGFETGGFSPWTISGQSESLVSPGHSGAYAARLGSTSPTNGNSTMSQTVTVPAGGATLSFWYQPHCPDTLTYDQEQMQVRNTAGAVLVTVLNVCSNSGAWTQVTASLNAYAGQTVVLWFNSHDDNYATDPTYTLFDDVSVQ